MNKALIVLVLKIFYISCFGTLFLVETYETEHIKNFVIIKVVVSQF